uniref:Uncharacterized protein n=1 Tax=Anguilla anguilla TaxID=7936 RepID=A0A0E9T6V6_ANGAN
MGVSRIRCLRVELKLETCTHIYPFRIRLDTPDIQSQGGNSTGVLSQTQTI